MKAGPMFILLGVTANLLFRNSDWVLLGVVLPPIGCVLIGWSLVRYLRDERRSPRA